ncbi:E3 ubiquitin-protein ligase dtx3L [Haplosporangium sp. Z 27]|nr:E3 ubiquitin-protein ligase dtx3L [Haplosporangium sp. Z 27]
MASPHSPTANGGASGLETLASTSAALHAAMIEDKTRTSLTRDTEKDRQLLMDCDKGKSKDMHMPRQRGRSPKTAKDNSASCASSSIERFSEDVQAHARDMSFFPDFSSSSQGVRKRKHSDDPITTIASGASTPRHQASPPSHSDSSSSTPPSSIPSTSASPSAAKHLNDYDPEPLSSDERATELVQSQDDEQINGSKRRRIVNVDDDGDDISESSAFETLNEHLIVIADDEGHRNDASNSDDPRDSVDNRFYQENDALSSQADDERSVVEVYGGSPEPLNEPTNLGESSRKHRLSPTPTQLSEDSDVTVTRTTANRPSQHSGSLERPEHSETSNRPTSWTPIEPIPVRTDDPEVEEVLEVIDLTRPKRRMNYPRSDSLARVPGLTPQHSFQLPTLQRLVSRSSESMERSQSRRANNSGSSIDVHEILDDDDEEDNNQEDRFGNHTVRIDSEVREVQLDPHHPWARGPIQLIMSPERRNDEDQYLEGQRRRRLEEAVIIDDHLTQIDYAYVESESDAEEVIDPPEQVDIEDDGVTEEQIQADANWILNLRRNGSRMSNPPSTSRRTPSLHTRPHTPQVRSPPFETRAPSFQARSLFQARSPSFQARSPPFQARSPPFQARSPPFQGRSPPFEASSFSFEAHSSPFPTSSRRSATPQSNHRPVARRPSVVPFILRSTSPMSSPPPASSSAVPLSSNKVSVPKTSKTLAKGLVRDSDATVASESWAIQNLKCSICMEVMHIPTMVRCGHAFCKECILRAMETTKICPMCRHPTSKNKLQELEFYVGSVKPADTVEEAGVSGA